MDVYAKHPYIQNAYIYLSFNSKHIKMTQMPHSFDCIHHIQRKDHEKKGRIKRERQKKRRKRENKNEHVNTSRYTSRNTGRSKSKKSIIIVIHKYV